MKNYSQKLRGEATKKFDQSFNCLSFELLKKAIGEDSIFIEYIVAPSNLEERAKGDLPNKEWKEKSEEEREEAIQEIINENYPMWNTVFEAKYDWISDKIMHQVDDLYDLGIGVIAPTDDTLACLFIAGAGYNFYDAHWIPLLINWGWVK